MPSEAAILIANKQCYALWPGMTRFQKPIDGKENVMRRFMIAVAIFVLVGVAAIFVTSAATRGLRQHDASASAAATCASKHCPPNTHCCYSCTGSPICVKNGVMCPECAPQ